eukprot:254048-Pleurochrysis_carterae.AAC.1
MQFMKQVWPRLLRPRRPSRVLGVWMRALPTGASDASGLVQDKWASTPAAVTAAMPASDAERCQIIRDRYGMGNRYSCM